MRAPEKEDFWDVVEDHQGTFWITKHDRSQAIDADGLFAFRPQGESRWQWTPERFPVVRRLQLQKNGRIEDKFLSPDMLEWALNVVVVRSGGRTILIDAGLGTDPNLNLPRAGQLVRRLESAGVDLSSVTDVVLTHLHMDHVGGLLVDGVRDQLRSDLQVHLATAEAEFWAAPDFSQVSMPRGFPDALRRTAKRFLNEYRSQLRPFETEHEVAPGVLVRRTGGHADQSGRIWFGLYEGGLGLYESGRYKRYPPGAAGLLRGSIRTIVSEPDGMVWFAGENGLGFFDGTNFQTLTRKNGLPTDNLSVAIKDDHGSYWFAGKDVIFSVTADNLKRTLSAGGAVICTEELGFADGLRGFIRPGASAPTMAHPLATKGSDGRLWFATGSGLAIVKPQSIPKNQTPPSIHIEKVMARGKTYENLDRFELPIGTRSCQIDYIGLSFANPAKIRYRYKLENYDEEWVDAGSSRRALYSNLKAQKYKFQVIACNADGIWNEPGDSVEFAIAPAFYETGWFPFLCALPIAMVIWGVHRLRVARATALVKQELEGQIRGQIKERKRIAQELHDTLLQGFTGIGLKLDAITAKLPEALNETKEQLRKLLDQSDQYLTEARRSVWELRSTSLEADDFAKALSQASERILEGAGIRLNFSVGGTQRTLPSGAEANLLRICEEAVTNALKHARPTEVTVNLEFAPQKVLLRIKDDGCGFDPQSPTASKSGHFGLAGLHERARTMGGSFTLNSQPGKGTEITVSVDTI